MSLSRIYSFHKGYRISSQQGSKFYITNGYKDHWKTKVPHHVGGFKDEVTARLFIDTYLKQDE